MKNHGRFILFLISFLSFITVFSETTIDSIFDAYMKDYLRLYPEWAIEYNITSYKGSDVPVTLNNVTYEKDSSECVLWSDYLKSVSNIKDKGLNEDQIINKEIFLWYMKNMKDKKDFLDHDYMASYLSCPVVASINMFCEFVPADNPQSATNFVKLLSMLPQKIKDTNKRTEKQAKKSIIPHPEAIGKLIAFLENFTSFKAKDNEIYKAAASRMDASGAIDKELKDSILNKSLYLIDNEIIPEIDNYISYLKELSKSANPAPGVWKLPDGDKYYKLCLRMNTGSDLSADKIHQLGLIEVKRIQDELRKLYSELGIEANDTFLVLQRKYWEKTDDPSFFFSDDDKGRQEVLDTYNSIIDEVYSRLPEFFSVLPECKVKAEAMPLAKTGGLYAYYQPPSMDNSRKGTFYVNLVNLPDRPGMRTLTYHEAVPGHHLQIALQQENKNIHMFRNTMFFTSFIEGWALYAEKMCYENGFEKDIHSKIAYLHSELFRAIRLVVDTGIHAKRWSREKAFNYMVENQGWGSYVEIDRYSMWPGQACAYKVGELKILELRNKAQKKLKSRYNLKDFNSLILRNGSMPLNVLEKTVDQFIREKSI